MFNLLIVDDEPLTREYIKSNVNTIHPRWTCTGEAGNGIEALNLIEQGFCYDLIVTDIKMPGMSGLELARALSNRPECPRIIIISGYDEFALAKEAMQYGVNDYMLKPIVKEELFTVLDKMAVQLVADRLEEAAKQSLLSLSEESRQQVAQNFLRAVITDNHIETKMLFPLLYRLKISLLEAEGAIVILDLDEVQLLERDISLSDQTLFRYIVHQTAHEIMDASEGIVIFSDHRERTLLFVPGEDEEDVMKRSQRLFEQLAVAIVDMTALHLWGAIGSSEFDVLQLNLSYRQANQALKYRTFTAHTMNNELLTANTEDDAKVKQLEKGLAAVQAAVIDNQDIQLHAALQLLIKEIDPQDRRTLFIIGLSVVQHLVKHTIDSQNREVIAGALHLMKNHPRSDHYKVEDTLLLYKRMIEQLHNPATSTSGVAQDSEHEIVTKVKEYILAHFAEPLSLALLAEKMNVSSGYLSTLFHQNTEESYIKYLTRVRMEHAAILLRTKSTYKIYDIAEKVGYLSVKHFSYVFKQYYGMPPGEYQERHIESQ